MIGGGLLGLEAANLLRLLGVTTHVVELAPRLMPLQVDEAGGAMLRRYGGADGGQAWLSAAGGLTRYETPGRR